jgi:signal transduction histidine kinase/ActR/RegA family two-component response regulator
MNPPDDTELIGVLAPLGRDAPLTVELLEANGCRARVLKSLEELSHALPDGLGAAIITEEALLAGLDGLEGALSGQPPWSDFPLVLLSNHGFEGARPLQRLSGLGNVTVLDRPVHLRTLLTAVNAALRSRRRQYEARRAIVQRDHFLAMLGHELRNPLGAIVFATESLRGQLGPGPSGRLLDTVQRQSRHLTRLVDDLLEVSRVTSGRIRLEQRPVDLRALLERTVTTLAPWIHSQKMHLKLDVPDAPSMVMGDEVRLEQVFSNLLTNALKYTPPGGRIWATLKAEGAEVVVKIRDDGIGLEPSMKERIFELFAQAETALDRSRGGLGLGLTLVRSLVELHGGTVEAQSEGLGKGTELTLRLPSNHSLEPVRPSAPRAEVPVMRLVVVEDNGDIRETLKELLELDGHTVEAAADGTSGLELITRTRPELAFIDLGLPGLDGFQVAEQVRVRLGRDVWLVALSGYGQPEDRERALKAGFDAHLTKPLDARGLKTALRNGRAGLRKPKLQALH